jgi:hypothetical protein
MEGVGRCLIWGTIPEFACVEEKNHANFSQDRGSSDMHYYYYYYYWYC